MGEQQRIYPIVDLEAAPRAPLVPRGVFRSEKGDPVHYNASVPEIRLMPTKRSCCCKCLCWTISILILLLISIGITLSGETESGSTLMKVLQEQQQTGSIPLDLNVDVPVAVKVGKLKLKKVRFLVGCNLVVDSLTT